MFSVSPLPSFFSFPFVCFWFHSGDLGVTIGFYKEMGCFKGFTNHVLMATSAATPSFFILSEEHPYTPYFVPIEVPK